MAQRPFATQIEIQFHRLPLSRAGLSQPARTGHELFQYLFQFAWRTDAAPLFTPGKSCPIRPSPLDDDEQTDLVHRRTSLRNPARFFAHARDGKTLNSR